jgi:hypothetical protein
MSRMTPYQRMLKEAEWAVEDARKFLENLPPMAYAKPTLKRIPETADLAYRFKINPTLKIVP